MAEKSKTEPTIPNSVLKNSEEKDVKSEKEDSLHHDGPQWKNTFCLEITPKNLVIPPNGHLEVTLKPTKEFSDEHQMVVIDLQSNLFEIVDPRAHSSSSAQIYGIYTKNDIINFKIGLKDPKIMHVDVSSCIIIPPEGRVTVAHAMCCEDKDTDALWKSMKKDSNGDLLDMGNVLGHTNNWAARDFEIIVEEKTDEFKELKKKVIKVLEKRCQIANEEMLKAMKHLEETKIEAEKLKEAWKKEEKVLQLKREMREREMRERENKMKKIPEKEQKKPADYAKKPIVKKKDVVEKKKKKNNPCCSIL